MCKSYFEMQMTYNDHKDIPGNPSTAKSSSLKLRDSADANSLKVLSIEDWNFWLEAINHLERPIGIQTSLLIYRRHYNNLTNNRLKMLKIAWRVFRIIYQWGILQSCWGIFRYLISKFGKYYI